MDEAAHKMATQAIKVNPSKYDGVRDNMVVYEGGEMLDTVHDASL
jgi:hypothetical protein